MLHPTPPNPDCRAASEPTRPGVGTSEATGEISSILARELRRAKAAAHGETVTDSDEGAVGYRKRTVL